MIIALCSAKASPGATTLAAWLTMCWPRDCVIVEADSTGGSLVARWNETIGMSYEPGLISLAATREGISKDVLVRHSQPVGPRKRLVAAPPDAAQTRTALETLGDAAATSIAQLADECDVIVDCGRLIPNSAAMAFARRAASVLLVTRPRLDEVARLRNHASLLCDAGLSVELVCVGSRPYHPIEVAAHVGVPLAAVIADDPRAAEVFASHGPHARALARTALARSVDQLASALAVRRPELDPTDSQTAAVPS